MGLIGGDAIKVVGVNKDVQKQVTTGYICTKIWVMFRVGGMLESEHSHCLEKSIGYILGHGHIA